MSRTPLMRSGAAGTARSEWERTEIFSRPRRPHLAPSCATPLSETRPGELATVVTVAWAGSGEGAAAGAANSARATNVVRVGPSRNTASMRLMPIGAWPFAFSSSRACFVRCARASTGSPQSASPPSSPQTRCTRCVGSWTRRISWRSRRRRAAMRALRNSACCVVEGRRDCFHRDAPILLAPASRRTRGAAVALPRLVAAPTCGATSSSASSSLLRSKSAGSAFSLGPKDCASAR